MIKEGQTFDDRYQMQRLLGRGAFSEVWLAHDRKTHVDVALKIYAPSTGLDDEGLEMFAHEFSVVMNINHRNLLKPIYFDDFERQPYLVLPYCPGGSVKSRIGKLSEAEAWKLLRDVAAGLAELHAKHPPVVHQDIKPDNIMQDDEGRYLITDFGVSTKLRSTLRRSQGGKGDEYNSAGTMAYMAPERFGRDNSPVKANDIWSLGATMFEMLTGDVPFGNLGGVLEVNGAEVPMLKCDCSDQLKQAVERCLAREPWDRPVAAQLEEWAKTGLKGGVIDFNRKWEGDDGDSAGGGVAGPGGRATEQMVVVDPARTEPVSTSGKDSGKSSGKKWGIAAVVVILALLGVIVALLVTGKGGGDDPQPVIAQVVTDTTAVPSADLTPALNPVSEDEAPASWFELPQEEATALVVTAPTELSLSCETSGATLYVDGVRKGTGSWAGEVSPGSHRLEARKDGYTTATHTLTVREGRTVEYTFPALTVSTGSLRVTSDPSGADVYIDGTRVGTTPSSFSGLTAGSHQVEVRKSGYTSATRTATVSGGQEVAVTLTLQSTGRGTINGHEYVDLGLSVKWATCNVGASSPSDYGNYYAWGETTTKSTYTKDNSKTYGKSSYNCNIDGDPSLDAARANWGSTWRLPTINEFDELINGCTWQWATQGGYNGYKVTSKKNGNSIFLPAAGRRVGLSLRNTGEAGYYWSSSPYGADNSRARNRSFSSSEHYTDWCYRHYGRSVRPVSE